MKATTAVPGTIEEYMAGFPALKAHIGRYPMTAMVKQQFALR